MSATAAAAAAPDAIHRGKVPFGQKVAFGMGMLANQMFPAALGIFMVVLVQDLGFPGWMWGLIYFLPRVFDSVTDPIMGFISDNTRSRWGRRRQYVFAGALIMGVAYVVMWQLYRDNSLDYNFAYFMGWSFVFYLGLTVFSVPYVAMGYEMSDDFHERTSIMATAQWIGQWAWVIAPWFWVIMYDPDWFPNADTATRTLAWWVGIPCMLLAMVPAVFIKSESTLDDDSLEPLSLGNVGGSLREIFRGFEEAFKIVPFRRLCIATFFIFNAFNTVAAFSFFIIVYYLFAGDAGAAGIWPTLFGSVGALVTTFAVIPTVAWMSKRLGKLRAFMLSQSLSVFGYVLLWFLFVPGKPWLFLFALPFFSFGIGSLFTLMMSMTADVIDLDELNTGKRREGIFGAIYWWMVKFGFAIAGGLSGVILSTVGFSPESYTEESITGLRLFFSGVPIAGTVVALLVMRGYDLTEDRARELRAAIEAKKAGRSQVTDAVPPVATAEAGGVVAGSAAAATAAGLPPKQVSRVEAAAPGATAPTSSSFRPDRVYDPAGDHAADPTADLTGEELRAQFRAAVEAGIHGYCYSAYEPGQQPGDQLSEASIRRRLGVLRPHTRWVRTFSCTDGNELIPRVAHELGLKTLVGAWLGTDAEKNEREVEGLIAAARAGHVDIAAVGNEVLYRGDLGADELIGYLRRVRAAIPAEIPVGYVDAYYEFGVHPEVTAACDLVLANCYPFWEACPAEHALGYLRDMYAQARAAGGGKRVLVTETGWPSRGEPLRGAVPSEENAMRYFVGARAWAEAEGVELFYFASFDEAWKVASEGEVGATWGVWDADEGLKYGG